MYISIDSRTKSVSLMIKPVRGNCQGKSMRQPLSCHGCHGELHCRCRGLSSWLARLEGLKRGDDSHGESWTHCRSSVESWKLAGLLISAAILQPNARWKRLKKAYRDWLRSQARTKFLVHWPVCLLTSTFLFCHVYAGTVLSTRSARWIDIGESALFCFRFGTLFIES